MTPVVEATEPSRARGRLINVTLLIDAPVPLSFDGFRRNLLTAALAKKATVRTGGSGGRGGRGILFVCFRLVLRLDPLPGAF